MSCSSARSTYSQTTPTLKAVGAGSYLQLAHCYWIVADIERLGDICRRWLELARALRNDAMLALAAGWFSLAFLFRAHPEPADIAAFADALRLDPSSLDLNDNRRFSLRGRWCATDAAGLRALLLAGLSFSWSLGVSFELVGDDLPAPTSLALADEARRLAQHSNDAEVEDDVRIACLTVLMSSPDAARLLDDSKRSTRLGYRIGGGGWIQAGIALGRLGRLDEMRALTEEMLKAAGKSGDRQLPFYALVQQAIEALVRGRFEEADATSERAFQVADPGEVVYQFNYALLTLARMLNTGQADDARPLAELLDSNPALDSSHLIGVVAAAQGDLDTTRSVLDAWRAAHHKLPVDMTLTGRLWGLAECAHAVGDADAAQHLYEHLAPFDAQMLVYGFAFIPASAASTLGRLAETIGDHDRALAHYTNALAFEESCGAETLAARTRDALAQTGS